MKNYEMINIDTKVPNSRAHHSFKLFGRKQKTNEYGN